MSHRPMGSSPLHSQSPAVAISAAGIVATICVAVTDVGVIAGFVPKFTLAPLANPPPFKVRVKAGPPEVALVGDIDESVRVVPVTEKFTAPEVPPPGAGFVTVTGKVPTVAISAARIAVVTWVEFTNVVIFTIPLNFAANHSRSCCLNRKREWSSVGDCTRG